MPVTQANPNVLTLVASASGMVQFVLLVLLMASVLSWAIIVWKIRLYKRVREANRRFVTAFWASRSMEEMLSRRANFAPSTIAALFESGFKELQKLAPSSRASLAAGTLDYVARALGRSSALEAAELERQVGWLATIANASPFIGLFGTVWGIMSSFQGIAARGSASLAVVAPGISEALIATAAGLFAAIPAVIAYNQFVIQVRRIVVEMDGFTQDLLNLVQQNSIAPRRE
jgi:biopolymer transport protein TolQ